MTTSIKSALRTLMLRELRALDREIASYPDDESIWTAPAGAPNSAGNLALHLAGNLRHFVGATLGETGYKRDRDSEFSSGGLSRSELHAIVAEAITELSNTFDRITDEQLNGEYPIPVQDRRLRTSEFLIHLAVHLGYHLGQIDYHRRLSTTSGESVNTISVKELGTS
jgi:uncharacterized damage-inducible protein DinB